MRLYNRLSPEDGFRQPYWADYFEIRCGWTVYDLAFYYLYCAGNSYGFPVGSTNEGHTQSDEIRAFCTACATSAASDFEAVHGLVLPSTFDTLTRLNGISNSK